MLFTGVRKSALDSAVHCFPLFFPFVVLELVGGETQCAGKNDRGEERQVFQKLCLVGCVPVLYVLKRRFAIIHARDAENPRRMHEPRVSENKRGLPADDALPRGGAARGRGRARMVAEGKCVGPDRHHADVWYARDLLVKAVVSLRCEIPPVRRPLCGVLLHIDLPPRGERGGKRLYHEYLLDVSAALRTRGALRLVMEREVYVRFAEVRLALQFPVDIFEAGRE